MLWMSRDHCEKGRLLSKLHSLGSSVYRNLRQNATKTGLSQFFSNRYVSTTCFLSTLPKSELYELCNYFIRRTINESVRSTQQILAGLTPTVFSNFRGNLS